MNVLTSDTVAVPDSSFPFSNELEGLLEPQSSPEDCAAAIGLKLASWQGDDGSNFYLPPYGPGMYSTLYVMVGSVLSALFSALFQTTVDWMLTGCVRTHSSQPPRTRRLMWGSSSTLPLPTQAPIPSLLCSLLTPAIPPHLHLNTSQMFSTSSSTQTPNSVSPQTFSLSLMGTLLSQVQQAITLPPLPTLPLQLATTSHPPRMTQPLPGHSSPPLFLHRKSPPLKLPRTTPCHKLTHPPLPAVLWTQRQRESETYLRRVHLPQLAVTCTRGMQPCSPIPVKG